MRHPYTIMYTERANETTTVANKEQSSYYSSGVAKIWCEGYEAT